MTPSVARCSRILALVLSLGWLPHTAVGQTCRIDRTKPNVFVEGDWTNWELAAGFTLGPGGSSTGALVSSGGNPGAFRRVDVRLNDGASPSSPAGFYGFHRKIGATYDPRTMGAIGSIDYCEDAIGVGVVVGDGQATGPALRQNGKVYAALPLITRQPAAWTTYSLTGLTAASFAQL